MELDHGMDAVLKRLDDVAAVIAAGAHGALRHQAEALLQPAIDAVERLRDSARFGRAPADAGEACAEVRRRIASIRLMLEHARQVSAGMTGILSQIYQEYTGSGYSSSGTPILRSVPRIVAQV